MVAAYIDFKTLSPRLCQGRIRLDVFGYSCLGEGYLSLCKKEEIDAADFVSGPVLFELSLKLRLGGDYSAKEVRDGAVFSSKSLVIRFNHDSTSATPAD
jgi:hypothetical protein